MPKGDGYSITLERLPRWAGDRSAIASPTLPSGACDSDAECEAETERMCKDAGHGGVKKPTVKITKHVNSDGKTCSGDCEYDGAVAFVSCSK
jgi:hypothetical protein